MIAEELGQSRLEEASVVIAERAFGPKGRFAYEAFRHLNETYFEGRLPWPLIVWGLTPHGACLASVQLQDETPIIQLHPSLLGGRGARTPWGLPAHELGPAFATDALLHECLHLAVQLLCGGASGPTSHNSPEWVAEVNRLAPLLGLDGFVAGRSTTVRLPDADVPPGSRRTRVQRVSEATLDGEPVAFRTVTGFPHSIRRLLQPRYYTDGVLPFRHALERPVSLTEH